MTLFYLGLTFLCSLFWMLFDFYRKKISQIIEPLHLVWWLTIGQLPVYLIIFFFGNHFLNLSDYALPSFFSSMFTLIGNIIFIAAIKKAPLSQTIPMLTLAPVFTTAISAIFLNETIQMQQTIATAIIIAGSFLLNSSSLRFLFFKNKEKTPHYTSAILMMCAVALVWSIASVLDKICLKHTTLTLHLILQISTMLITLSAWFFFTKKSVAIKLKKFPLSLYIIAIITVCAATVLQFMIIQHVYLGIFETIKRATGLIGAAFLGTLFLKEKMDFKKVIALTLMIVGVVVFFYK